MFADNRVKLPITADEGSVAGPLVQFAPTPDGFTDLQSRFIDAFIQLGGNGEKAAIAAGYAECSACSMAMRNLATKKIGDEVVRRLKLSGASALAVAIGALLRICEQSEDDRAVVAAANSLADRFGLAVPRGPAVQVNVSQVNGSTAQALMDEVWRAREQRLKGTGTPTLSAIPAPMADNAAPSTITIEQLPDRGGDGLFD